MPRVGFAGDGDADDVDDAQRQRALFLRFAQGRERVGGFAGLADRDDDRVLFDERIAIAELAGVRALGDDLREIFHQVIADQRRVPRGALAGEDEAPGLDQLARRGRRCRRGRSALRAARRGRAEQFRTALGCSKISLSM